MASRLRLLSSAAILLTVAGWVAPASAQDAKPDAAAAPSATSDNGVDDIVVTASKREQSLSKVGLTITAATGQQLLNAGVVDIKTLTASVPSFSVTSTFDGVPIFSIRGMGFAATQLGAAPTVSVYVDEAPLPYSAMTGGVVLDLERVEALKGPQGTLFGNNSTAGSMNFIATKPTTDFSGGLRTSIDRFGRIEAEGFLSGPLSDTLRVRIAASNTQGGAWQRTYTAGPRIKNGDANKGAERFIAEWQPNSGVKLTLNLNHYYDKSEPQAFQFAGLIQGRAPTYVDPLTGFTAANYPRPPADNRAADLSVVTEAPPGGKPQPYFQNNKFFQTFLRGEFDLSNQLKLVTITNYARLSTAVNRDLDGTRIQITDLGHRGAIRTIGQEIRLVGDFPTIGVKAIAGLNYADDKINESQPFLAAHYSGFPIPDTYFNPVSASRNKTAAVYANVEYQPSSQITLLGGIRYTRVHQDYSACNTAGTDGTAAAFLGAVANQLRSVVAGLPPVNAYVPGVCATLDATNPFDASKGYLPAPPFVVSSTDTNVAWRVGVNYQATKDLLAYGLVSRGYKAGAFPFLIAIIASQYNKVAQEQVTSYEAGLKYSPSRVLSLSTAGFYYDYRDKQVYAVFSIPVFGTVNGLTNIPRSKAYGFEFEGTLAPIDGLRLHGALTYLKTKILDQGNIAVNSLGTPTNLRGNPFAYAPEVSAVFDAEYRVGIAPSLNLVLGTNGSYTGSQNAQIDGLPDLKIDKYWLFDARIGLQSSRGWSLTAAVRNLTNKYYFTDANFSVETYIRSTGLPRNVVVTASYRF